MPTRNVKERLTYEQSEALGEALREEGVQRGDVQRGDVQRTDVQRGDVQRGRCLLVAQLWVPSLATLCRQEQPLHKQSAPNLSLRLYPRLRLPFYEKG